MVAQGYAPSPHHKEIYPICDERRSGIGRDKMDILRRLADNRKPHSIANKTRSRRFEIFKRMVSQIPLPISVLDLGGTQEFWEVMGLIDEKYIYVTIINIDVIDVNYPNFKAIIGDATELSLFGDKCFDIVFSNSVIEHVGNYSQQCRMAQEVQRVGKSYFIQTPNKYFPIEPHFLIPFFQFLPDVVKKYLVRNLNFGWYRVPNREIEAIRIRLLTEREIRRMFPTSHVYKEKYWGLTKSFIILGNRVIE
jgi:hypothetical protein